MISTPIQARPPSTELRAGLPVVGFETASAFGASPGAAAFFATLKGANRYAILYRLGMARLPETRTRRIAGFVAMLERGGTIHG